MKSIFLFLCALAVGKLETLYPVTEPVNHGEGPTWDPETNSLYYVDIHTGTILKYNLYSRKTTKLTLSRDVTPVIQIKNKKDSFVIGWNRSLFLVEWDGQSKYPKRLKGLVTVADQFPGSRFNDGKADKQGRLWIGTLGYEDSNYKINPDEGILYKFNHVTHPEVALAPVNVSNGLAWNKKNNAMYYIDSRAFRVDMFDFDEVKGRISNQRIVFDMADHPEIQGEPDGMTIDKDDNLWIALYGGWAVIKVNPRTGELLQIVEFPVKYVTSVMWGGPNLDLLFATTSRRLLSRREIRYQPYAGSLFIIEGLGTHGFPAYKAKLK